MQKVHVLGWQLHSWECADTLPQHRAENCTSESRGGSKIPNLFIQLFSFQVRDSLPLSVSLSVCSTVTPCLLVFFDILATSTWIIQHFSSIVSFSCVRNRIIFPISFNYVPILVKGNIFNHMSLLTTNMSTLVLLLFNSPLYQQRFFC